MTRILVLLALLLPFGVSQAQEGPDPSFPTPPRISLLEGDASFWRPGAPDWAPAVLNTPLESGDSLSTGPDTTAEVQIGPHAYLRLRNDTQVELSGVEPDFTQLKVTGGEASLDVRDIAPGHTIEVDTPNAAYTVERAGYYRLNVDEDSTSFVARRGGTAEVTPAGEGATRIEPNEQLVVSGTDQARLEGYAAPQLDEWDRWNYERTDYLVNAPSARYVPAGVYGAGELDQYGHWRNVEQYGPVWVPSAVPAGWAPYSAGHWIYDPLFGWTWVDNAPWGYAPFHYGRWVYVRGTWAWAPGPRVARPVYAPALVAWYHGGPASGGVSVGWVALGWGEPVSPWWGPSRFAGHPYWGGWGGPRVVTNVTHVTYVNAQYRNAVIATNSERFGRGDHDFHRAAPDDMRRWRPSERGADVRPSAVSLMPAQGRAARAPRPEMERRVVALHPARDPGERLHEAGLRPPEHNGPAPRIASPAASQAPQPVVMHPGERERGREQADQRRAANGPQANPAPAKPSPRANEERGPARGPERGPERGREQADQKGATNGFRGNPEPAKPSPQTPPARFAGASKPPQPQKPQPQQQQTPQQQQANVRETSARNQPVQERRPSAAPAQERQKPVAAAEKRNAPTKAEAKTRQHPQKGKKEDEQSRKE